MNDFSQRVPIAGDGISTQKAVGAVTYRKKIIRLSDLPIAPADPVEIGLGTTSEIRIFSDFPIDIGLGDSGKLEKFRTDLMFRGQIDSIRLRSRNADVYGCAVVYQGDPYLGVDWQRENPLDKPLISFLDSALILGGVNNGAGSSAFFPFDGVSGYGQEAFYLRGISFNRNATGNIEWITYQESESGLSRDAFYHRFKVPTGQDSIWFDNPIRISARGNFRYFGSVEVANTFASAVLSGNYI